MDERERRSAGPPKGGIPILTADDIHRRRWMLFVDGENFAIRGRAVADKEGVSLSAGDYYVKDVFLWLPNVRPRVTLIQSDSVAQLQTQGLRAYYYTSMIGAHDEIDKVREQIWRIGFQPEVFKRPSGERKAKGVDIALTKDMLSNAFQDNYDVAVLVAGDGDYVPLVEEVKRLGKLVYLMFLDHPAAGFSTPLRLASDEFYDLRSFFCFKWRELTDPKSVHPPKEQIGGCTRVAPR
jgi:uncharacterized LabA/DUF88 family protein